MHIIVIVLALFALIIGPGLWVKAVMRRYQQPANRYAKTGSQVARELLDSAALRDVRIEPTESGDHYDPAAKAVRLSADNFNGRSLTANSGRRARGRSRAPGRARVQASAVPDHRFGGR